MSQQSDTPITFDAWDAYDRGAAGSAYVKHTMAQLESQLTAATNNLAQARIAIADLEKRLAEASNKTVKRFRLHWRDGTAQDIEGADIQQAVNAAGIGNGAMFAMDYWEKLP